jgi:hypothetical protein
MFEQKMHSQGLNGIIDKMHTLIVNDAPPKLLDRLNYKSKVKTMKG